METKTLHRVIGRPLDRPAAKFELRKALSDLRAEPMLDKEGIDSIILHKEDHLKVVLTAMRAGAEIRSHRASVPISVQVLEGFIRFKTEGQEVELRAGDLLTLHAGLEHGVQAIEKSAFLLTLSGPREP